MGSPAFDYRLGAVVDLDTSEYKYIRPESMKALDPPKKRNPVAEKADWYVEQQNKKLNKDRKD